MKSFSRLTTSDRLLIAGALLCIGLCAALILDDRLMSGEWLTSAPEIGFIQTQENDTRVRNEDSLAWNQTKADQRVHLGDAVYAGERSMAQVQLKKGGSITVGENSMLVFREIKQKKIASLEGGNFRIQVNGEVQIAVGGNVTTLKGTHSDVQVFMGKDQKPAVKLLRGKASLKQENKAPVDLSSQSLVHLDSPVDQERPAASPVSASRPVASQAAVPLAPAVPAPYTWRLYDLYERNGLELTERPPPPELAGSLTRPPRFLPGAEPLIVTESGDIAITAGQTSVKISLSSPVQPVLGFVTQSSDDPAFSGPRRQTVWISSGDFVARFSHPGRYYYRFRAVNKDQELSEWSATQVFNVYEPPPAPILAETKTKSPAKRKFAKKEKPAPRKLASDEPATSEQEQVSDPVQSAENKIAAPIATHSPRKDRSGHSLWIGSGATYTAFQENSNDSQIHVNYASTTAPSIFLEGRYEISDRWRFLSTVRNSTGEAKSSSTITVSNSIYNWLSASAEGAFTPESWRFTLFRRESSAGLRLGFQYHSIPFLSKTSTSSVSVENNPVTMASIGAGLDTRLSESTKIEAFLRYQYPLASSAAMTAHPGMTFDGSLGLTTALGSSWTFGGFWYGQMQSYPYSRSQNNSTSNGTEQIFFSSVEARLGYFFK